MSNLLFNMALGAALGLGFALSISEAAGLAVFVFTTALLVGWFLASLLACLLVGQLSKVSLPDDERGDA